MIWKLPLYVKQNWDIGSAQKSFYGSKVFPTGSKTTTYTLLQIFILLYVICWKNHWKSKSNCEQKYNIILILQDSIEEFRPENYFQTPKYNDPIFSDKSRNECVYYFFYHEWKILVSSPFTDSFFTFKLIAVFWNTQGNFQGALPLNLN